MSHSFNSKVLSIKKTQKESYADTFTHTRTVLYVGRFPVCCFPLPSQNVAVDPAGSLLPAPCLQQERGALDPSPTPRVASPLRQVPTGTGHAGQQPSLLPAPDLKHICR